METIKLKVLDQAGHTLMTCPGSQEVSLVYTGAYQPGDRIALEIDHPGQFCVIQLEDTMLPALVYVVKREINFHIPFGEQAITYSPKSFQGSRHLIRARLASPEELESQETEDIDEMGVYREINRKFGVAPVRLRYKPSGTILERYIIDEDQRKAFLFYNYDGEIIRYTIYMNDTDSSFGQKDLDNLVNEYNIENSNFNVHIQEYDVEDSMKKRFIAEFEYQGIQYQLMGAIEQEEFDKVVKNLFLFEK